MAAMALPLYSMQVYDRVLTSRNLITLVMVTGIALFMLAVYAVLDGLRGAILNRASVGIDRTISERTFEIVLQARLANPATGAARALRDVGTIRDFVSSGGLAAFLDLPWVPLFIVLAFSIHSMLGTVAVLGTILIAMAALGTEFLTRKHLIAAAKHTADAQRHSASILRDAETVSALGMRSTMQAVWMRHSELARSQQARATGLANTLLAATKFLRLAVQIAIMGVAGYLVIQQAIQPGIIFAASLLIGRSLAPVEQAVASWRRLVAAREAVASLAEVFAAVPVRKRSLELPRPAGRLSVENAFVTAPGTTMPLLKGVSFAIEPGETLAIVGASGSGKSTLVRAMAGIWSVASGAVRLDGAALSQWDPDLLGRFVGYLPQDVVFFEGTIAQNIARHGKIDGDEIIKAARIAGVHEAILRLPQGYETSVGVAGETLSGGMRQRVALARALYGGPSIVILDEPNSSLDAAGDQALAEALAKLKTCGTTVVLVSHRPNLVAGSDKVLVMAEGVIHAFGPREQIMQQAQRPRVVAGTGVVAQRA
jgi:PrtD family type I secretion system ABC transporter